MPLHFKGIALTLKMNDRVSSSSSPVAGIITRGGISDSYTCGRQPANYYLSRNIVTNK